MAAVLQTRTATNGMYFTTADNSVAITTFKIVPALLSRIKKG